MSADIIQAQYDQLDTLVSRFAQQADATIAMLFRLDSHKQQLENGGWIGRGATAFSAEMNGEVLPAVQRLSTALHEGGVVLAQMKTLLQQAEAEAAAVYQAGGGALGASGGGDGLGGGFSIPGPIKDAAKLLGKGAKAAWDIRRILKSSDPLPSAKDLAKKGLKSTLGPAITALTSGYDNWQTYKGTEYAAVKIVAGTAVDTALKAGLTAVGTYGGTLAGGALGAAIGGPVGAVIGAKVGGVIGGFLGGKAADLVAGTQVYKNVKGAVVDGAVGVAKGAGKALKTINPFD